VAKFISVLLHQRAES